MLDLLQEFTLLFYAENALKPPEVQCLKCMPHFLVAEIRISLLFDESAIFCSGAITTINSLL